MYCDTHSNQLIQVVPEVIVVNQLDQYLYFFGIILKLGCPLIKFLDDVADLPAGLTYFNSEKYASFTESFPSFSSYSVFSSVCASQ